MHSYICDEGNIDLCVTGISEVAARISDVALRICDIAEGDESGREAVNNEMEAAVDGNENEEEGSSVADGDEEGDSEPGRSEECGREAVSDETKVDAGGNEEMIEGDDVDLEGEEGRNSDGEGFGEECGGGIEGNGIHSSSEECIPPDENMILPGTIPAVLKWTREVLNLSQDREIAIPASRRIANQEAVTTAVDHCKVRVAWVEGKRVSGGSKRFWKNVTRFASTLPNNAAVADNIFDAMSRYPDSVLVYSGLTALWEREENWNKENWVTLPKHERNS